MSILLCKVADQQDLMNKKHTKTYVTLRKLNPVERQTVIGRNQNSQPSSDPYHQNTKSDQHQNFNILKVIREK